jgi:hypothetical protein
VFEFVPALWIVNIPKRVIGRSHTKTSPKLLDCWSNALHAVDVEMKPAERIDVFPNERRYVA